LSQWNGIEGEKYDLFIPWNRYVDATELQCPLFPFGIPAMFLCHLKNSARGQTCRFVLSDAAEIEKVWML